MKGISSDIASECLSSCAIDYVILHAAEPLPDRDRALGPSHQQDQSVYEERHLRYISPLGKVTCHLHELLSHMLCFHLSSPFVVN